MTFAKHAGSRVLLIALLVCPCALAQGPLHNAFYDAAADYDVPVDVLLAVGYVESRWQQRDGVATIDQGYGVMHLTQNDYADTLGEAAALLGVDEELLKQDAAANILGAAAILRANTKQAKPPTLDGWVPALLRLSGLYDPPTQAIQVAEYVRVLHEGVQATLPSGETLRVAPQDTGNAPEMLSALAPPRLQSEDYGPAIWNPADPSNYGIGRGGDTIQFWVNHWIGTGTYGGAISWFKNPSSDVSAHFVVRASDGELTQMVRLADTAWHARTYNSRSIGIEHDVIPARSEDWHSVPMLQASTTACRVLTQRYGIPQTRSYIIGHQEVPGAATQCPGPLPWTTYMSMVQEQPVPTATPTPPASPIDEILIECRVGGQNTAWYSESGGWADSGATCTASGCTANIGSRYASTYRSVVGLRWAAWRPTLTVAGPYDVYVAWPFAPNRRTPIRYRVDHAGGATNVNVDQAEQANVWLLLGRFDFHTGTGGSVTINNESLDESGSMFAAAARFVYRGTLFDTPTPTASATQTPTQTNTATATATPTPALPDIDGDGIPDHLEYVIPSPGQTNRYLADSDGDGLLDGQEDANRNGIRDPGETDPRNADSDGDGLEDGVEVGRWTPSDPLDPDDPPSYTDADNDGLPLPEDWQDHTPDSDGDRYRDGYEYAYYGINAVFAAHIHPPLGDVNQDGAVSNLDALVIQALFLGQVVPGDPVFAGSGFIWSDLNRDGHFTNLDALMVQGFFLNALPLLPLE